MGVISNDQPKSGQAHGGFFGETILVRKEGQGRVHTGSKRVKPYNSYQDFASVFQSFELQDLTILSRRVLGNYMMTHIHIIHIIHII